MKSRKHGKHLVSKFYRRFEILISVNQRYIIAILRGLIFVQTNESNDDDKTALEH